MKRIPFIVALLVLTTNVFAAHTMKNYVYAQRDTLSLSMDVYTPEHVKPGTPCLVFVFGGGFKIGSKSTSYNTPFLKAMADSGYVVASIDYRLGMKGAYPGKIERFKALQHSVQMAVEDLISATSYLVKNAQELSIDPQKIIISGSSAGAITVLQTEFELCNGRINADQIAPGFRYAGVISFAGGIMAIHSKPTFSRAPAPVMFFHGMKDKLVRYDKLQFMNSGFYGTNSLVKVFDKYNYPYFVCRYRNMGHEIAGVPMNENRAEICSFIREFVLERKALKIDMTIQNPALKPAFYGNWKPGDLYRKNRM